MFNSEGVNAALMQTFVAFIGWFWLEPIVIIIKLLEGTLAM